MKNADRTFDELRRCCVYHVMSVEGVTVSTGVIKRFGSVKVDLPVEDHENIVLLNTWPVVQLKPFTSFVCSSTK